MGKQLKSPIKKFNEHLSSEQAIAKKIVDRNTVSIINGQAGTGKTHLAVCYALEQISLKNISRIIITRATVMRKNHNNGFLPGDINDKFSPWLQPIYDNVLEFFSKEELEVCIKNGIIEIVPLAFVQGRTFKDAVIIVDEAQNLIDDEVEMLFSRIGRKSKMVFCGDLRQQIIEGKSGLTALIKISGISQNTETITLTENFRDPIVQELLGLYEKIIWNDRKTNRK